MSSCKNIFEYGSWCRERSEIICHFFTFFPPPRRSWLPLTIVTSIQKILVHGILWKKSLALVFVEFVDEPLPLSRGISPTFRAYHSPVGYPSVPLVSVASSSRANASSIISLISRLVDRITTISYYIWWCIRSEEWADRFSSKKILECRWAIIFLSTIFNVFWEYDHIDLPNIRDDIIVRVCRISIHIEPKWWEFFYIALFISSSSFSFLIFCSETEYEFMILVSGGIFYSILFEYFCKFSIIPIWYFFECLDFSRGIFYPTTFDTFCTKFIECWFFCEAFWENFRSYLIISCVDRRKFALQKIYI